MLYAKTWQELVSMMEMLVEELGAVGLQLNAGKTKILTTICDQKVPAYIDVCGELVETLGGESCHKYLGRKLCGNLASRVSVEFAHKLQVAWRKFSRHRSTLVNKNASLALRMKLFDKLFDALVSPTILFGLSTLPLTKMHVQKLDTTQRKMLRSMVGWIRVDGEDWADTMRRMNTRICKFFVSCEFVVGRLFGQTIQNGFQSGIFTRCLACPRARVEPDR